MWFNNRRHRRLQQTILCLIGVLGLGLNLSLRAWAATAPCEAPLNELHQAQMRAIGDVKRVDATISELNAAHAKLLHELNTIVAHTQAAQAARNERDFSRAAMRLDDVRKKHDALVENLAFQHIQKIEVDRALRGARQAVNEALLSSREQGAALVRAAERVTARDLVPSLQDLLICQDGDCGAISARDHAAMVTIGAIAETLDPAPWPLPDRACDFTVFDQKTAAEALARSLRTQTEAAIATSRGLALTARAAEEALDQSRMEWIAALSSFLDNYYSPAANSHAEELMSMATADLERATSAYVQRESEAARTAAEAAAARSAAEKEDSQFQHYIAYWTAVGRALVAMAEHVARGEPAIPQSSLNRAALAVIGMQEPDKDARCWLVPASAQKKAWVFAARPPDCQ